MKTYRGYGGFNGTRVEVEENDVVRPLLHYVRHSPDGFSWGYAGSGPSELARCILLDYLGLNGEFELPVDYQAFKFAIVAHWPWDAHRYPNSTEPMWTLTGEEIEAWLAKMS